MAKQLEINVEAFESPYIYDPGIDAMMVRAKTYPDIEYWDVVVEVMRWTRDDMSEITIELEDEYEPQQIPALIATLQRAQEIAAQWAAEGSES